MTNHNDTLLQFCATAEALLSAHADDDKIVGYARPQAQCEFARRAYGALEEACELVRELMAENEALRTGLGDSEAVPLRMFAEVQAENEKLRETMPCGHPRACVISADGNRDSTAHCAWCADLARWRGLLEVAADNAEGFREMLVECERETAEMKAELALVRGKASGRGGK